MVARYCARCGLEGTEGTQFCAECGVRQHSEADAEGVRGAPLFARESPSESTYATHVYAGFWVRLVAWVIDMTILAIAFYIISNFIFNGLIRLLPTPFFYHLLISYEQYFRLALILTYFVGLTVKYGRTLGKMALGLKVVDANNVTPSFESVLLRETLGKLVSTVPLCLGYLWIGWNSSKKGWHDWIAFTCVVRK